MRTLTAIVVSLVAGPILLNAQLAVTPTGCTNAGQELRQPVEIRADEQSRVLRTELDIRQFDAKGVLTYHTTGCQALPDFKIRNYGWRTAPGKAFEYGYPGPTLRLRKASAAGRTGDALQILLTNHLPDLGADACNQECDDSEGSGAQCVSDTTSTLPNCFHGNNTTNLHFHGLHVSPQSPQDFVLLELQPEGSKAAAHASHGSHGEVQSGSFLYSVNPLQWNQPEGTHWYHPHKHGSTALQLGNGMAGALIVEGPFDDWLNAQFPQPPREKILVLQQIHDLNFLTAATTATEVLAPIPMINGQIAPKVTMYPGEIQRWRFIAATIDATAQLEIDFDGPSNQGAVPKQISMDGVQFAPENYAKQPLLPSTQNGQFRISPGNRADFLVQAPAQAGKYSLTYEVFGNVGSQGTKREQKNTGTPAPTRQSVRTVLDAIAPGDAEPVLLSIEVVPCNDAAKCPAMEFPSTLPPLPWYLRNIGPVDDSQKHTLGFFTNNVAAQPQTIGILVDTTDQTEIQTFQPDCAVFTQPLGSTGEWTLSQNLDPPLINNVLPPFHVFHIHTNAFQVMSNAGTTYDPPIWMDSITLPHADQDPIVMRTRFEDYTGHYVLHCHFLGHEDRGMMLSVQTVCANDPGTYGTPDPRGGADQCTVAIAKALPPCGTAAGGRRVMKKE